MGGIALYVARSDAVDFCHFDAGCRSSARRTRPHRPGLAAVTRSCNGERSMSPNNLSSLLVIASILCASTGTALRAGAARRQRRARADARRGTASLRPPQARRPHSIRRRRSTRRGTSRRTYPPQPPPASAVAPERRVRRAAVADLRSRRTCPRAWRCRARAYIKDWEEGTPIPYGYHHETRARKGMVIAGSILFGVTYLYSASSRDRRGRLRRWREPTVLAGCSSPCWDRSSR